MVGAWGGGMSKTTTTTPATTPETERVEIRVYRGKATPELVRVVGFTIPLSANGATKETSRAYDELNLARLRDVGGVDGIEYVVDPGGSNEAYNDFDGVCPEAIRCREEDDDDHRREIAREEGMLHGIDAYNEVMGY